MPHSPPPRGGPDERARWPRQCRRANGFVVGRSAGHVEDHTSTAVTEMFIKISDKRQYLRRAVDQDGTVLDIWSPPGVTQGRYQVVPQADHGIAVRAPPALMIDSVELA